MDIDGLDITQLRLLEALAQTYHLSEAAARVGISQSAASHALARLRHDLQDPLFVRTSRGMRPTPYGERLSDLVVHALAALRSGLETPGSFDPRISRRTFTLLLTDLGQVYFLPKLVERLAVVAPGVTLRANPSPSTTLTSSSSLAKLTWRSARLRRSPLAFCSDACSGEVATYAWCDAGILHFAKA